MPRIKETDNFQDIKSKLDKNYLIRLEKVIRKIINNLEIGKPMMYERKGAREVYLKPFRVSYVKMLEQKTSAFKPRMNAS